MICRDVATALDAYLDDELSVLEVLRVQNHLHDCGHCRAMMEAEAALRALLEADAMEDALPPALRDRVVQRVAAAAASLPAAERWRRGAAVVLRPAIALAALLALALLVPGIRGPIEPPQFAMDAAAQYRFSSEAVEPDLDLRTTDLHQLAAWMQGRVGLSVSAPTVNRPKRHLVGGSIASLGGVPAAHLVYEWDGQRLSLFVIPTPSSRSEWPEREIDGVDVYTARLGEITVSWWDDAEHLYIAASPASARALTEFARLCIRNRGQDAPSRPQMENGRG